MPSWQKLLRQMANDPKPVGYTYAEAARVLAQLGFTLAGGGGGGSHRLWRRPLTGGTFLRIGLVEKGHGKIPREYIGDMVEALRAHDLIDEHGEPR